MQDYIIKNYNKHCESLISHIFDKQNMAKMMRTFKNLQEFDFKYVFWMNKIKDLIKNHLICHCLSIEGVDYE